MLSRMIYISTAVGPITTAVTGTILRSAQAHNAVNGITGVLCQGQGVYLQVLEGERSQVDALYARILQDKRHQDIVLRQQEDIKSRRYGRWAMAHIDLTHLAHADAGRLQLWPAEHAVAATGSGRRLAAARHHCGHWLRPPHRPALAD